MIGPIELCAAFFLDAMIGDPRRLPHPVRLIGRAIVFLEDRLRSLFGRKREKAAGVVLVLLIVLSAGFGAFLIQKALLYPPQRILLFFGTLAIIYLVATTIALHELVDSASLVIETLKGKNIAAARSHLSMIVGRDTGSLDEDAVLRAVIETVAENLSDGVIAPLFYLVIGGLPFAISYKAINTLDSMVGYKNEKYQSFGWAAARLDDIANYIPARITGVLIGIASYMYYLVRQPRIASFAARRSFNVMARDGRKHTSPNSGISEAAMAGALGVRLGGPSTYGDKIVQKPFIGDDSGSDYLTAAKRSIGIAIVSACVAVIVGFLVLTLRTLA